MKENSQPLAILYGYSGKGNETHFIGRKGIITIGGKSAEIKKILRLCNGLNSLRNIIELLSSINSNVVVKLISFLEKHGIVRDSRELHIGFHEDSSNPSDFSHDIGFDELEYLIKSDRVRKGGGKLVKLHSSVKSKVLRVIRNRRSVRQFMDSPIPMGKLSGLLQATYSRGENKHWSVASGGGLYPLDLYIIISSKHQVIPQGIYRWNPERNELSIISDKEPSVWLEKVFNAKTLLENVACILCVAANLKRSALKYANLGYRLTVLEAGHAVQNASLFCIEQNLGLVECCGFGDKALAQKLGLNFPNEAVITTLIVGTADNSGKQALVTDQKMVETAGRLRHAIVGDKKPITDILILEPKVNNYAMPKWAATCTYRSSPSSLIKQKFAFATGSTSSEATVKVLAEGFERYALEQNRSERKERANKLKEPFLDPRLVVPYSPYQLKFLKGIGLFDPDKEIEWVAGVRQVNGEKIWVPKELVYYATKQTLSGGGLFYRASSSGVAAHFDKQVAIESALYELIERDAFSVAWYAKRCVCSIPHERLPNSLISRILSWKKLGYRVSLLDLTLDGPPVVLVLIWSREKTPALCSGASCRPMFLDAVDRAFNEAEFMAMTWHRRRLRHGMKMSDIKIPDDHGLFYVNPKNLIYADWLLNAVARANGKKDFNGSLDYFDPIVVDITPKEPVCGLTVIRVLSEKLMPINFGYGNEHRGHSRMKKLGYEWSMGYPSTPHFFA